MFDIFETVKGVQVGVSAGSSKNEDDRLKFLLKKLGHTEVKLNNQLKQNMRQESECW